MTDSLTRNASLPTSRALQPPRIALRPGLVSFKRLLIGCHAAKQVAFQNLHNNGSTMCNKIRGSG